MYTINLPKFSTFARSRVFIALVLCLFAAGGVYYLAASWAALPTASVQVEAGTLTLPAKKVTDTTASNGSAVQFSTSNSTPTGTEKPLGIAGSWTRVFTDEFNNAAVDATKWATNWFGGTTMNGYEKLPSNISFANGSLQLAVAADKSGAILTSNPFNGGGIKGGFQMGTDVVAEARIYAPGNGQTVYNWPAWWTTGQSWPKNGEYDIFEVLGGAPSSNYHYADSSGNHVANNSGRIAGTWANAYHTYAVHRKVGSNDIYWDGQLVRTYKTYDNGAHHYLILTSGPGGVTMTGSSSVVKIDYVRVWKQS